MIAFHAGERFAASYRILYYAKLTYDDATDVFRFLARSLGIKATHECRRTSGGWFGDPSDLRPNPARNALREPLRIAEHIGISPGKPPVRHPDAVVSPAHTPTEPKTPPKTRLMTL